MDTEDKITLKTKSIIATVMINTGAVSFTGINGKTILQEKRMNGRSFEPVIVEGRQLYHIKQTFETTPNDAIYGLGQHQDDVMNYRYQQVTLFQNNTEVAIPFLVSNKNYGILWDNYSISKVGDVRPCQPLSALKLFSKKGEQGWLTASYSNNRKQTEAFVFACSQLYAAATWSGDIAARWEDMRTQITAGINISLSGTPYRTMDISGFAVELRYEKPTADDLEEWREQMTRWYQFGAFCPLFRVHGQYPYREIFNKANEDHAAYQNMLYYDKLRYEATKTLTINKREGNFTGMLAKRTFRIIWVSKDRLKELNAEQKATATVIYKGEKMVVKMKSRNL